MTSIGITSRGDSEEKLLLVEDLLHTEQHLAEEISKRPEKADELLIELDEVRKTRQKAVKEFGGDNVNSKSWCRTKHLGMAHLRSQELLNNAARIDKEGGQQIAEIAQRINVHRDKAVKDFLNGSEGGKDCKRCAGDLSVEENIGEISSVEQVSEDNTAFFVMLLLGIGLSIYAFSKLQK